MEREISPTTKHDPIKGHATSLCQSFFTMSTMDSNVSFKEGESDINKFLEVELLEYVIPKETKDIDGTNSKHPKRKREENEEDDEDAKDILTGIYLRTMYPLNKSIDKTVTVGSFQSLSFQPAVLLNHASKSSLLFPAGVWEEFTKYCEHIATCLQNNLTGKKTSIMLLNSDIEVDIIRLRGSQFVRFRNLSKHQKKINLSCEEFHILSNLVPAVTRYLQQLVTYDNLVEKYLKAAVLKSPPPQVTYGSLDVAFYNKLPFEVDCYRRINQIVNEKQNGVTYDLAETVTTENSDAKPVNNEESSASTQA